MKNTILTLAVISVTGVFTACNKKLNVLPQQQITPNQITTGGDVKALLFGAYNQLQSGNGFGEAYQVAADLLASDTQVNFIGTFEDYHQLQSKEQIKTNLFSQRIWGNSYKIIGITNTVLDKLNLIETAREKTTIEGEAKFIRGLVYFELVNFFGQPYSAGSTSTNLAVPLVLAPVYAYDETKHKPARSTIEAVYGQILKDLGDAEARLPLSAPDYRADAFAAKAILARVYMAMGKYDSAASKASQVIIAYNNVLEGTYSKLFNNTGISIEDIFTIQQSAQSNAGTTNAGLTTFYSAQPTGRGDLQIAPSFKTLFENTDQRLAFLYDGYSLNGIPGVYTSKWTQFYKAIPVVRMAEMFLTRGEANFRKGGAPTGPNLPIDDLNAVRTARGASALVAITDGSEFVKERARELAFEGDKLWTRKRVKMYIDGLPYNSPKLVLPIPQSEIDVNPNLIQNGGY